VHHDGGAVAHPSFVVGDLMHTSVINGSANENAFCNEKVNAPLSDLFFESGTLVFAHPRWRINPNVTVFVFKMLRGHFNPCLGPESLCQQAQFSQRLVNQQALLESRQGSTHENAP
jgi:hypothetical protein